MDSITNVATYNVAANNIEYGKIFKDLDVDLNNGQVVNGNVKDCDKYFSDGDNGTYNKITQINGININIIYTVKRNESDKVLSRKFTANIYNNTSIQLLEAECKNSYGDGTNLNNLSIEMLQECCGVTGNEMLDYIDFLAKKWGMQTISLEDVSFIKFLPDCTISLIKLSLLSSGQSWYETHGYSSLH